MSFGQRAEPRHIVAVSMSATNAVNVFFVDEANFQSFEAGQPYQFWGQRGALEFNRTFEPPTADSWHLVVHNPTDQSVTVTIKTAVRMA